MVVLILSAPHDIHALSVSEQLQELNVAHRIWNYSDFIDSTSFLFSVRNDTDQGYLRFSDRERLELDQLTSVWFRRPGKIKTKSMPEPWVEDMIAGETYQTLGGILRSLDCLLVNNPNSDSNAHFKLSQLSTAKKLGLLVPETIVTNEPEIVRSFYQRHSGSVVYKLIDEGTNFCFPLFEIPVGVPTLPMRESDLQHLSQVQSAPHLFQQRILKIFDVRVTVVGEKIFAATIQSQVGKAKLDWRFDYSVPMERLDLPEPVSTGCLKMMRAFQLNYAAFDFCVDEAGQYFFLELNCAGQYLWLEQRIGLPISKELALLLSGKTKAIVEPGSGIPSAKTS